MGAIIGKDERTIIHVAAPDLALAQIHEHDIGALQKDDDDCFVVRPDTKSANRETIFRERAESCVGIRFDYDAENSHCETFANAIHGEWGQGLQAPSGVVQQAINQVAKLIKFTKRS